jgi:hypothetical protein
MAIENNTSTTSQTFADTGSFSSNDRRKPPAPEIPPGNAFKAAAMDADAAPISLPRVPQPKSTGPVMTLDAAREWQSGGDAGPSPVQHLGVTQQAMAPAQKAGAQRQQAIHDWTHNADPDDVYLALKYSIIPVPSKAATVGMLSPADKSDLVRYALAHLSFNQVETLALKVRDDDELRPIVAEQLLSLAVREETTSPRALPQTAAQAFLFFFLKTMEQDPKGLAQLLSGLLDQESLALANATRVIPGPKPGPLEDSRFTDVEHLSAARNQILEALNQPGGKNETLVYALFQATPFAEFIPSRYNPSIQVPSAHNLAVAQVNERYPGSDAASVATRIQKTAELEAAMVSKVGCVLFFAGVSERRSAALEAFFDGYLTADQLKGPNADASAAQALARELLVGGRQGPVTPEEQTNIDRIGRHLNTLEGQQLVFGEDVPQALRAKMLFTLLKHPEITPEKLQAAKSPWFAVALAYANDHLGSFPDSPLQAMPGHILRFNIGMALGLKPDLTGLHLSEKDKAALKDGQLPPSLIEKDLFKGKAGVETVENKILELAKPEPPELAVRRVVGFGEGGITPSAVFLVRSANQDGTPREVCIDANGHTYEDVYEDGKLKTSAFKHFLAENDMPERMLVYRGEGSGELLQKETPAVALTTRKVLRTTAHVGEEAVMVAAAVGTDGAAAVFFAGLGIASMGYLVVDEGIDLAWLHARGEKLTSRTALEHFVSMAANLTGMGGEAGRFLKVAGAAGKALRVAAATTNAVAAGVKVRKFSEDPTPENFAEAAFAVFMFGKHALSEPKPSARSGEPPSAMPTTAPPKPGESIPPELTAAPASTPNQSHATDGASSPTTPSRTAAGGSSAAANPDAPQMAGSDRWSVRRSNRPLPDDGLPQPDFDIEPPEAVNSPAAGSKQPQPIETKTATTNGNNGAAEKASADGAADTTPMPTTIWRTDWTSPDLVKRAPPDLTAPASEPNRSYATADGAPPNTSRSAAAKPPEVLQSVAGEEPAPSNANGADRHTRPTTAPPLGPSETPTPSSSGPSPVRTAAGTASESANPAVTQAAGEGAGQKTAANGQGSTTPTSSPSTNSHVRARRSTARSDADANALAERERQVRHRQPTVEISPSQAREHANPQEPAGQQPPTARQYVRTIDR